MLRRNTNMPRPDYTICALPSVQVQLAHFATHADVFKNKLARKAHQNMAFKTHSIREAKIKLFLFGMETACEILKANTCSAQHAVLPHSSLRRALVPLFLIIWSAWCLEKDLIVSKNLLQILWAKLKAERSSFHPTPHQKGKHESIKTKSPPMLMQWCSSQGVTTEASTNHYVWVLTVIIRHLFFLWFSMAQDRWVVLDCSSSDLKRSAPRRSSWG